VGSWSWYAGGVGLVPGEGLVELAQWASQMVVAAAITDVWELVRDRIARLLGRGDARKIRVAEQWLAQTYELLAEAANHELEPVRVAQAARWAGRFADLLDEDPGVEAELRALVEEAVAQLPSTPVSAIDHSMAAGRDITITASGGGTAAGVIHGNIAPPGLTRSGPGGGVTPSGAWNLAPGSAGADRGGIAVGMLAYQRRPELPSQPIRLAPRPAILAGREELLAELHARLADRRGQREPRTVALCGLGGAGKTSVAVEYAHRHLAEVAVCWQFGTEDVAVLTAEFAVLAAQLGARDLVDPRDPVASVHAVLARQEAGWLVVFDNARDRASVERFVPPAGPGRVLITTQNQHWPPGQALDVPVLDLEVAADFLVNRSGDPDRTAASELGGLPLALEQAAAYMHATGTTLARYLLIFRDRQADLLARGEAFGHPADVAATLGLAVSRLVDEAPSAAGLLCMLAFLAPEPVPLALLLTDGRAAGLLGPEVAAAVGSLVGDPVAAGDAIASLRRYSLVSPVGDGLVLVHRLVQALTRAQLPADSAGQWEQATAALVDAAIPADADLPANWPVCAALLPHARVVLNLTSGGIQKIAQYLGSSGSYAAARELFRLIADAHWDAYGPEHLSTLAARHNLAYWTGEAGDAPAARDQLAALLSICERILGSEHPDTLAVRYERTRWTADLRDAARARDQFTALLPICERVLGPEHRLTLTVRHQLSRWTGEAGDAAGARDQFAALLPLYERVLGTEHPDTLDMRGNLAYLTGLLGDATGARDQFAALLPIREQVLGTEHPSTLLTRHELACWTAEAGDTAGARDQSAALLPLCERVLGPEHLNTLNTRHTHASQTGRAGDAAAARDQAAALLPICERVLGTEHRFTLAVRHELARWTGVLGDAAGARDQLAALLPLCERTLGLGLGDRLILTVRHELARWTGVSGDAAGARDQLAALLLLHERILGPEHPDTLNTRHELARWTRQAGEATANPN
jgi:hypothetical protein